MNLLLGLSQWTLWESKVKLLDNGKGLTWEFSFGQI